MLEAKQSSFAEVIAVLQEYRRNIGDAEEGESADASASNGAAGAADGAQAQAQEANRQREILTHLIDYLRGC